MPVGIVCDSAASLPRHVAELHKVVVVPMGLSVDGRRICEDEIAPAEVTAALDRGAQTSGPSPGAFAHAIDQAARSLGDEAAADGHGVVVLTVGSRYSSTFQAARMAALAQPRGSPQVRVVDTGTAAGAEGLVVLAAAEAAAAGADLDHVQARANMVASRVRLVAAAEQLTHLVRGGRVPASLAHLGQRAGVRVLFELSPKGPRPLRTTLSLRATFDQLLGHWRRTVAADAALHVAAMHALRPVEAQVLLEAVAQEMAPATAVLGELGPVMLAHTGPGMIGLAWWWEQALTKPR